MIKIPDASRGFFCKEKNINLSIHSARMFSTEKWIKVWKVVKMVYIKT